MNSEQLLETTLFMQQKLMRTEQVAQMNADVCAQLKKANDELGEANTKLLKELGEATGSLDTLKKEIEEAREVAIQHKLQIAKHIDEIERLRRVIANTDRAHGRVCEERDEARKLYAEALADGYQPRTGLPPDEATLQLFQEPRHLSDEPESVQQINQQWGAHGDLSSMLTDLPPTGKVEVAPMKVLNADIVHALRPENVVNFPIQAAAADEAAKVLKTMVSDESAVLLPGGCDLVLHGSSLKPAHGGYPDDPVVDAAVAAALTPTEASLAGAKFD